MLRVTVLSLLSALALAAPAAAAPPNAAKLRALGVKVAWPATGSLQPGHGVEVRVTSRRARSRVALVRVDTRGRVVRSVARATLRSGTFRAALPADAGARYTLQLAVGKLRYFSLITTPKAVPPVAAPTHRRPRPRHRFRSSATSLTSRTRCSPWPRTAAGPGRPSRPGS